MKPTIEPQSKNQDAIVLDGKAIAFIPKNHPDYEQIKSKILRAFEPQTTPIKSAESKDNRGLYGKYEIRKIVPNPDYGVNITSEFMGTDSTPEFISVPVDPKAEYFVLRLDKYQDDINHLAACRIAINSYSSAIKSHLPKLSDDLNEKYLLLHPKYWWDKISKEDKSKLIEKYGCSSPIFYQEIERIYNSEQPMHYFASLQTTEKEKEFCEKLEKMKSEIESLIKPNRRNTDLQHGENTAYEAAAEIVDELIQNYKK